MSQWVVEPWNAVSAALFLLVAVFWLIRLRGRYRQYPFLTACLPLAFIGGVGGTVYHAFRGHAVWLFMDWMPIAILCLAISVYLWSKLFRHWTYALLVIPIAFLIRTGGFALFGGPRRMGIAVGYVLTGVFIMAPAVLVLWRTRGRYAVYPVLAAVFFILAIVARQVDAAAVRNPSLAWIPDAMPMGVHFIWHVFGALAGHMIAEYLYRLPRVAHLLARTPGPPRPAAVTETSSESA
jgi:uncharacterized membrane protein